MNLNLMCGQVTKVKLRGPWLHCECFKPLLTMKCMALFQTCTFVYAFTLSLFIKNCSGDWSFSALKRLKNYLWSTLKDDHILAVLRALNYSSVSVLDQFLERLTREVFQ